MNRYKYSESRKFHTLKEMYSNIKAARILGIPEYKIKNKVSRRGIDKDTLKDLFQGVFTPERPGRFFVSKISEITRDLNEKEGVNIPNPYFEALPNIDELINDNRRINLDDGDLSFYRDRDVEIENESVSSIQPLKLPPSNASAKGQIPVVSPVNTNLNQATTQIRGKELFQNDITFS